MAAYEVRLEPEPAASNVVPFPARRRDAVELPYFPNLKIACGHFKTGRADSEEHRALPKLYGPLDPSRHFAGWLYCELEHTAAAFELRAKMPRRFAR